MKHPMLLPLLALGIAAAPPSPIDVVERQLAAYNAHDADAFAATYADDAQVFKASDTAPVLQGRAAIRARYAALFASRPDVRAEVSARMVAGNFVSDHETIVGTSARAIVVYDIKDGLIRRAWLFGPPSN